MPKMLSSLQHNHATKRLYSSRPAASVFKYSLPAGLLTGAGVWWLATTGEDVMVPEIPAIEHSVNKPGLSKDEITRMLSKESFSSLVGGRGMPGVSRYYGAQLASNSPCEDRSVHGELSPLRGDSTPWMAWAVFDGHAGWQTADLLEKRLLPLVQQSLSQVNPHLGAPPAYQVLAQRAITKAFVDLDSSIMDTVQETSQSQRPLDEKMQRLMPAFAGSCALVALYDPVRRGLHVACTGDSRAVLGQRNADGTWEAIPLSVDQTGSNPDEVARINQEHPGEEDIAKNGRIHGIMVSRAFGDGRWKWPLELQKEFQQRFGGQAPLTPKYNIQTPPYITAEPVVTTTFIDPTKPSFLILATDGLWDSLSNQQAVDLVGTWLEPRANESSNNKPKPTYAPFDFGQLDKGVNSKFEEERATYEDQNVAVHLMRNSLGGNHEELIAGRLAASNPFSRDLRDDITVQVAFFNCSDLDKR
ncbi:putative pyruvate dehydrogenase [Aureobasidium sp. EXF-8845]|nr:putative pyruvate dehydrogenase [Aureobasidium sp. EXF-8845]KAI4857263.1 putative pyruvate dehydrogenase [Aureobasidium sp. EXF-8846]